MKAEYKEGPEARENFGNAVTTAFQGSEELIAPAIR